MKNEKRKQNSVQILIETIKNVLLLYENLLKKFHKIRLHVSDIEIFTPHEMELCCSKTNQPNEPIVTYNSRRTKHRKFVI